MRPPTIENFHVLRAMAVAGSMLASYAAFSLAERIERTDKFWPQRLWLTASAFVLGLGMWSMHFFGALEGATPNATVYQLRLVLLCLLLAVSVSWAGLRLVVWRPESRVRLIAGGSILGVGTCAMHFLGQQAERTSIVLQIRPQWVLFSALVGAFLSIVSLWLVFGEHYEFAHMEWLRVAGSALMGTSVAVIGVISLRSLVLAPLPAYVKVHGSMRGDEVGEAALMVTFGLVLLVTFGTAAIDKRRFRELSQLHAALAASQQALLRSEVQLREANAQLSELSIRDSLTGLYNRRRFDETLDTEWKRSQRTGRPLALLMIDVDCFKSLNDNFGHQRGDSCLREIAHVLEAQPRRGHDMVARFGGEEFAVLLPGSDAAGALTVAENIRRSVEDRQMEHPQSQASTWVTVSIGLCSRTPKVGQSAAEILYEADMALYSAKQTGRNRVAMGETVEISM